MADGLLSEADGTRQTTQVALIATVRKLLAAVYSVAKNRRHFVPFLDTQPAARFDYEKLDRHHGI